MNEKLNKYFDEHKVCNAYIFRNWEEFLQMLFENNGRVKMIVWYDYCKIVEQHKSLGSGGYRDLQDADYMWAETPLYETELNEKSLDEILDYISAIKKQYSKYDLYPEFYVQ